MYTYLYTAELGPYLLSVAILMSSSSRSTLFNYKQKLKNEIKYIYTCTCISICITSIRRILYNYVLNES